MSLDELTKSHYSFKNPVLDYAKVFIEISSPLISN